MKPKRAKAITAKVADVIKQVAGDQLRLDGPAIPKKFRGWWTVAGAARGQIKLVRKTPPATRHPSPVTRH